MKHVRFFLAALVISAAVNAQTPPDDHATHHPASAVSSDTSAASPAAEPSAVAMTEGEVRKVDKDAKKLTLKHGPIANLDMPGMTMVFRVADPTMLDSVKQGDKVRFVVNRVGGLLTITRIELAQ